MPAEASSLPLCFLGKCADSYVGVAQLLLSEHWVALVFLILGFIGLFYAHRWWQKEAVLANGVALAYARFTLLAVFILACSLCMGFSVYQSVTGTPSQPLAEKGCTASAPTTIHHHVYYEYEAYPTLQPISCPERGSTCHPPTLFARMNLDIQGRPMNHKGHVWQANSYKQPAWAEVANDLGVEVEYNHEVLAQLERASKAVEMRDTTISRYMHRAQTDNARLVWSRKVHSGIASQRTVPNKTSTRILCDFLRDTAEIQNGLLTHPTMIELEQSVFRQQNWTVQTYAHIQLTATLSKSWLRSVDTEMRDLTWSLKEIFAQRVAQGSSHAKDYQKYKDIEQDTLSWLQKRERTMCARADEEDRGEKQEMEYIKTDLAVMDTSELMWDYGSRVRMGATHISAYASFKENKKNKTKDGAVHVG